MDDSWVHVEFRKWPDKPHWHYRVFPLGEDAHGRWFCSPLGNWVQRGAERPLQQPHLTVKLIPADAWWAASWNGPDARFELYVDIATPARWQGNTVSAFDLDLDVVRERRGGAVRVLDEDEFAEHQVAFGYPPELIASARRSADALQRAVTERREPFDRVGASWLAQASERSWPAIERWM
jgi:uncharacterized protein